MPDFSIPTSETVSANNQNLFDNLQKGLGFVPNLYATFAHSENALGTYLALQNAKSSLRAKEREVINLVVSQVNGCRYCLAAHTVIGKMNGFTDEQILAIRTGEVTFDPKIAALAALAKDITENRGHASADTIEAFYAAGYANENLIDTIMVVGDKIISNYLHAVTQIPVDFPAAPALTMAAA